MRPISLLATCHQATLLLERQAQEELPLQARLRLWGHLRFCPYCRRYQVQTKLIDHLARAAFKSHPPR